MTPRAKMTCLAAILAAHLALPLLMRSPQSLPSPTPPPALQPIVVSLLPPPPPPPPVVSPQPTAQSSDGGSPASATPEPTPPEPPPPPVRVRPARPTTQVEPVRIAPTPDPAPPAPPTPPMPIVGAGQLAGALTAGSGAPGGGAGAGSGGTSGSGAGGSCDMVARLQAALRDDAEIRAAVAAVPGSASGAVLVWDGEWIQSPGQAGKGLATVRQAIALEVAFAPPACRAMAVRGLALITLEEGPGAARLALGKGAWRWSDLVSMRR